MNDDNNTACKILMTKTELRKSLDFVNEERERLQQENQELNDSIIWWTNRFNAVQRDCEELKQENERLKQELNCKEYFSSTMPENTEFVILKKNNYDRQQKDIQLELIDYKSRIEKAVEYLKQEEISVVYQEFGLLPMNTTDDLLNILNGRSDE